MKTSEILFEAAQMVARYRDGGITNDTSTRHCCYAVAIVAERNVITCIPNSTHWVVKNLPKLLPEVWYYLNLFKPKKTTGSGKEWFKWGDHPEQVSDEDISLSQLDKIVQNHRTMALLMAATMAEADGK